MNPRSKFLMMSLKEASTSTEGNGGNVEVVPFKLAPHTYGSTMKDHSSLDESVVLLAHAIGMLSKIIQSKPNTRVRKYVMNILFLVDVIRLFQNYAFARDC
jgi:hypothetical protein